MFGRSKGVNIDRAKEVGRGKQWEMAAYIPLWCVVPASSSPTKVVSPSQDSGRTLQEHENPVEEDVNRRGVKPRSNISTLVVRLGS